MRQYVLNLKKYDDDDDAKERKWHCMKCMNSQGYGLNFIIAILDMNNFIITILDMNNFIITILDMNNFIITILDMNNFIITILDKNN